MPRQAYRSWWVLVVSLLVFAAVAMSTEPAEAKRGRQHRFHHRGHHHRGHHHRGRHFHRHRHYRLNYLFGFYHYPYYSYYPYWPYYSYGYSPGYYAEGDHRRFPAFRMPAFFRYPGAIAKGEDVAGPLRQRPPGREAAQADDLENDRRPEQ